MHLHGRIKIKEIIKFYLSDYQQLKFHGAFEIDTIEDSDKWEDYCIKQEHLMSDFCHANSISYVLDNQKNVTGEFEYKGSNLLES